MENLKEKSVIAQHIICDYVNSVGGILNVPLTGDLLTEVNNARQKYERYLESEREKKKVRRLYLKKQKLYEIAEIKSKKK